MTSKSADETTKAFADIYKKGAQTWPSTLMVDDGHEFKGAVSMLMSKHNARVHRTEPGNLRSQAFVESFNRRLAERIFRRQAQEELDTGRDNRRWVGHLQAVVADMNLMPTRLTGLGPQEAISVQHVPLIAKKPLNKRLCCLSALWYTLLPMRKTPRMLVFDVRPIRGGRISHTRSSTGCRSQGNPCSTAPLSRNMGSPNHNLGLCLTRI